MKLLAIDPGKMTGWAEVEFNTDGSRHTVTNLQEVSMDNIWSSLQEVFSERVPDCVVIEDFKITTGTGKLGSPDWSLRIIGAVEYLAYLNNIPVVKQTPANAKAFSTNERLRAVEMWHKGGAGHANDALRHALLFMVKKGWRDNRLLDAE